MITLLFAILQAVDARKAWEARCANCHSVPDTSIQRDRVWLGLIKTTAWSGSAQGSRSAALREGLVAYLTGDAVRPAPRVDAKSKSNSGDGALSVNFPQGAVLLVPVKEGAPVRVVFSAKDDAPPVAAGAYRVANYAIETEHKGAYWALSGSGDGQRVEITAGRTTKLTIDDRVTVKVTAGRRHGDVHCSIALSGDSGMGLTVLNVDKQTPLSFEVRDGTGAKLDGGAMAYG